MIHIAIALTLPTNLFVAEGKDDAFGYWTVAGPVFHVFMILYIVETVWADVASPEEKDGAAPRNGRA